MQASDRQRISNRRGNTMPMAPLATYQNAVVDRYKSADGTTDYEKAWSYLDRIMGREVGKAGGLLTFNAILIAIAIATGPWWSVICPTVASLLLLLLLGVSRGTPSEMATARDDLMAASRTAWQGMSLIDMSIIVSAIGIMLLGIWRLV
jgi:hypothetical protein